MASSQPVFTCSSCSIAFGTPDEQRAHYQSDHHRYNMKRRVASLEPISATIYNQKVLERKAEISVSPSPGSTICKLCNKFYVTENAYKSHTNSKKHKETEARLLNAPGPTTGEENAPGPVAEPIEGQPSAVPSRAPAQLATEEEIIQSIDEEIAVARSRLSPENCLFCPTTTPTLEENLSHMSISHSFFVPDADYLCDITGLIAYLGEKIAVQNFCIYCNERGREFRTPDAVRKHMLDKGHCKIAYDTGKERLEISDFYDFTRSYPANVKLKPKTSPADEEWEDVEGDIDEDGSNDEVVDGSDSESLSGTQITYGTSAYELILPSGARVGHRNLRRYCAPSFRDTGKQGDRKSGAALVKQLLVDRNSALVPMKGGFGAYGQGTQVVKARNRGEAREAGRHVREFRDQKRRENFRTKVGFKANSQKFFRDPLLGVLGA